MQRPSGRSARRSLSCIGCQAAAAASAGSGSPPSSPSDQASGRTSSPESRGRNISDRPCPVKWNTDAPTRPSEISRSVPCSAFEQPRLEAAGTKASGHPLGLQSREVQVAGGIADHERLQARCSDDGSAASRDGRPTAPPPPAPGLRGTAAPRTVRGATSHVGRREASAPPVGHHSAERRSDHRVHRVDELFERGTWLNADPLGAKATNHPVGSMKRLTTSVRPTSGPPHIPSACACLRTDHCEEQRPAAETEHGNRLLRVEYPRDVGDTGAVHVLGAELVTHLTVRLEQPGLRRCLDHTFLGLLEVRRQRCEPPVVGIESRLQLDDSCPPAEARSADWYRRREALAQIEHPG